MTRRTNKLFASIVGAALVAVLVSATTDKGPITKSKDTTVVNTTPFTKDVVGYRSTTPVKIYIKKNKVIKVQALPNRETPKYFQRAKEVLAKYNGQTVSKAANMEVDGVSGATLTSKALVKNVQEGLKYYKSHK